MSEVKKRLVQYINNQGLKVTEIVKKISVSAKYFNSKGAVGSDVLEKISLAFPHLNMDWVITGREPITIYQASSELNDGPSVYKTDKDLTIERLKKQVADQEKLIERSGKMIDLLQEQLAQDLSKRKKAS